MQDKQRRPTLKGLFAAVALMLAAPLLALAPAGISPAFAQSAASFMVGTWRESFSGNIQGQNLTMTMTSRYSSDGTWSASGTVSDGSRSQQTTMSGGWTAQMRSDGSIELRTSCSSGNCGPATSNTAIFVVVDSNTLRNSQNSVQVMRRQ